MADIFHDFGIKAPAAEVFKGFATSQGMDFWWTEKSSGKSGLMEEYVLGFGPGYEWRAKVTKYVQDKEFELQMIKSDPDWQGTRIGIQLEEKNRATQVRFYHTGWRELSEHYRFSSYCWAMYLRILKRYLEKGEQVPFENRLDV